MNTQAERLTSRRAARVSGFTYLKKLAAWIERKREAYRAHRHALELRDTLGTLSPDLLDDIGVALDANGDPRLELATRNPHVIVTNFLDTSPRYHDPH
jgi:hypothetical protein